MEIVPEKNWDPPLAECRERKGTALIIGPTDSGKSTLAYYLLKRLLSDNLAVSLIDSDVGQSSLGLPGTISMRVFSRVEELHHFRFEVMHFVGTVNPAMNIPGIIRAAKMMTDVSKKRAEIVLMDTTGLISGETGRSLKLGKIHAIHPERIIAVQRGYELEHILSLIDDIPVYRIMASDRATVRSQEQRFRYRKMKHNRYFQRNDSTEFLVRRKEVECRYMGRPFIPKDHESFPGMVIGLNHDEFTEALGIIDEIDEDTIAFRSPLKTLKGVNTVIFGDIQYE